MGKRLSDIFYINNKFSGVTLPKHFHDEYTISLVYSGEHLFTNEKDRFKIVPGVIQVVNPYELHSTANSTWSHLNIMPTTNLVESIASDILQKEINETILFNTYTNDEYASYLLISLFESLEDKGKNRLEVDNAILEFLDYMLRNHSSIKQSQIVTQNLQKNSFASTIEYIDANISNANLSLDDLSLNAGLSKFYFSREFKKHFGVSPSKFIQIKKVNKVKELIKKDMGLADISYECGFTDQSYMIKVFKRYTGYTPSLINTLN